MANTFAPFGFQHIGTKSGAAPTMSLSLRRIASSAAAIYFGDPVQPVVSTANGYIMVAAANTTRIDGIFAGCNYLSTSQKRRVWSNYWPGSDATGDVFAHVVDDPNAIFLVQGNSTTFNITGTSTSTFTSSPVGQYAQFAVGTPSAATGLSGAYLNSLNTTATLPFIVLDLVIAPPGANGTDPTSASNYVVVGFNNELLRTNGAGPTGIS